MLAESEGLAPLKRTRAQQFSGLRPYQLGLTLRRIIWQERQDLNPHELIWNRSGYLYLTLLQKTLDARGRICSSVGSAKRTPALQAGAFNRTAATRAKFWYSKKQEGRRTRMSPFGV